MKKSKTIKKGQNKTASSASRNEVESLRKQVQKLSTKASTPFANVGAHMGNMVGFKDIGKGVGSFIGRILGSGDYSTNFSDIGSNSMMTASVPAFSGETTVITHREYIQDIISSSTAGGFKVEDFSLNPGLSATFPWLSSIAQNYEEYDISGMIFEFKSMSGQSINSVNTALGSVVLATQYDPTRPGFEDKQEMENHFFAQSSVPSQSVMHAIECKKGLSPVKTLYIRTGAKPSDADLRWTDFGNFYIATVGLQGTSINLGELWVSYKVTLRKPRLPVGGIAQIPQARLSRLLYTNALPLGTTTVVSKSSLLDLVVTGNTISFLAMPTEYYLVEVFWYGTPAAFGPPVITYNNFVGSPDLWFEGGTTSLKVVPTAGSVSSRSSIATLIKCSSVSGPVIGTITFDGTGNLPGPTTYCDIVITAVSSSLTP